MVLHRLRGRRRLIRGIRVTGDTDWLRGMRSLVILIGLVIGHEWWRLFLQGSEDTLLTISWSYATYHLHMWKIKGRAMIEATLEKSCHEEMSHEG